GAGGVAAHRGRGCARGEAGCCGVTNSVIPGCASWREIAKAWDIVSRALRSMERLRNDALQTRDPGALGQRGSRLKAGTREQRDTRRLASHHAHSILTHDAAKFLGYLPLKETIRPPRP